MENILQKLRKTNAIILIKQTYLLHYTATTINYNMVDHTSCCHVICMAGTRLVLCVHIHVLVTGASWLPLLDFWICKWCKEKGLQGSIKYKQQNFISTRNTEMTKHLPVIQKDRKTLLPDNLEIFHYHYLRQISVETTRFAQYSLNKNFCCLIIGDVGQPSNLVVWLIQ